MEINKKDLNSFYDMLQRNHGFDQEKLKFFLTGDDVISGEAMTPKEFIDVVSRFDKQMATKIESWLNASQEMGDYIRLRLGNDTTKT